MKNIIITGASSGIGAQISRQLFKEEYKLSLLGRNLDRLISVSKEFQDEGLPPSQIFKFDITDIQATESFCNNWLELNKEPLKALIINAGYIERMRFKDTPLTEWEEQFQISVHSPVAMIKAFWDRIIEDKTTIITISSTLGIKPIPDTAAYSSAKAAMINWSNSLAAELAPYGIRVNCICPGIIQTPIHGDTNEEWNKMVNDLVPLGRAGKPQDVAEMVSYLISDKAEWITGTTQVIDGGLLSLK